MKLKLWRVIGRISSSLGISYLMRTDSNFILMFHHVGPSDRGITAEDFEEIIDYIDSNYDIVDLNEVLHDPGKGKAAITFDDGYMSFYENALPILEEHGIPATLYINPGLLTEEGQSFPDHLRNEERMITLDQAQELSESEIVSIENHGKGHRDLTKLDDSEVEKEISEGKEMLQEMLDTEVTSFCYPFGRYNDRTREIAAKMHENCTTVTKGFVQEDTELSEVPRIDGQQDLPVLKWELTKVAEKTFQKITVNYS